MDVKCFDIIMNVTKWADSDLSWLYYFEDFDFQLKPGWVAVDAGVILPNVNDDFTVCCTRYGAFEVGKGIPVCGPLP